LRIPCNLWRGAQPHQTRRIEPYNIGAQNFNRTAYSGLCKELAKCRGLTVLSINTSEPDYFCAYKASKHPVCKLRGLKQLNVTRWYDSHWLSLKSYKEAYGRDAEEVAADEAAYSRIDQAIRCITMAPSNEEIE